MRDSISIPVSYPKNFQKILWIEAEIGIDEELVLKDNDKKDQLSFETEIKGTLYPTVISESLLI